MVAGGVPPDKYQLRVQIDQYVTQLLAKISDAQKEVTTQLKQNICQMDKRLNANLKFHEWHVGDKVLF